MPIDLAALIVDVPDFPRPGVGFKDITPLLASPGGLAAATEGLVRLSPNDVDVVVGLEARGFIFGPPVALALGVGFVPVRKPGKLPRASVETTFDLEYGQDTLALHADALRAGDRVLIVDDVLATGGTAVAAASLVEKLGAQVVGLCVVVEIAHLNGRDRMRSAGHQVASLIRFETG